MSDVRITRKNVFHTMKKHVLYSVNKKYCIHLEKSTFQSWLVVKGTRYLDVVTKISKYDQTGYWFLLIFSEDFNDNLTFDENVI